MAYKDFTNMSDLLKYLQTESAKVLQNEVAEVAKQQMHEVIEEVTYEQYTPTQYVRTHELSDVSNMEVTIIDNDTIQIVNTRRDGDTDVARVVSTGLGYSWLNSAITKVRPPLERNFYEDTINFLRHNGKHIEAYKRGMKKRGFEVI